MAVCGLAAWKSQSSRVLPGAPRTPPCSPSPLAPCSTVRLLGDTEALPSGPEPALAQANGDKTTEVVATIPLLALR